MAKVLVVDDDIVTRKLIARKLEREGFVVIQASDGLRAWQVLCDNPDFSLLITDMMMPELDGRLFIERVRAHAELSSIPVIIISAYVPVSSISDLLKLGASRFLPKPIDSDDLVRYAKLLVSEHKDATVG